MSPEAQEYFAWVMRQKVAGKFFGEQSRTHLALNTGLITGHVTLRHLSCGTEVIELCIERSDEVEPTFFLRFILGGARRARDLFREMARALAVETHRGCAHVLICTDDLMWGEEFIGKLQAVSGSYALLLDFELVQSADLVGSPRTCTAIVLDPTLDHLRGNLVSQNPEAVVFPIPDKAFVLQDAHRVMRLLLEALHEIDPSDHRQHTVELARPLPQSGTVLVMNIMYGDRCVRCGYRVYEASQPILGGVVIKARLAMDDIDDLLDTLPLKGVEKSALDAIGIVVPGVVNDFSMNLPGLGDRDPYLCEAIERKHGIPAFMDNNTNAAAMGCYLMQEQGDSLTLYRHQLGHKNGGQGTVIAGRLVTGRYCLAGEPKFYQRNFSYRTSYSDAVWTSAGLSEISRNVLLASIGTVSPDVAYLAVSTIDDTCALQVSLEHKLPKYCIPELVAVDDYRERMYLGEVALCLGRLVE